MCFEYGYNLAEFERYLETLADTDTGADADVNTDESCDGVCDYGDHGFWYI